MSEFLAKWTPMEVAGCIVLAYAGIRFVKAWFDD